MAEKIKFSIRVLGLLAAFFISKTDDQGKRAGLILHIIAVRFQAYSTSNVRHQHISQQKLMNHLLANWILAKITSEETSPTVELVLFAASLHLKHEECSIIGEKVSSTCDCVRNIKERRSLMC